MHCSPSVLGVLLVGVCGVPLPRRQSPTSLSVRDGLAFSGRAGPQTRRRSLSPRSMRRERMQRRRLWRRRLWRRMHRSMRSSTPKRKWRRGKSATATDTNGIFRYEWLQRGCVGGRSGCGRRSGSGRSGRARRAFNGLHFTRHPCLPAPRTSLSPSSRSVDLLNARSSGTLP